MTQGTLSEQMGAMACVDTLRRERRQVQEHMDLPQQRADVAARIREYYRSQGIPCDEATIEDGVRLFFAQRLVFEAPIQPWYKRLFATLLIRRQGLLWTLVWIVLIGGTWKLLDGIEQPDTASAQAQADGPDSTVRQARQVRYNALMTRLQAMPTEDVMRSPFLQYADDSATIINGDSDDLAERTLNHLQLYADFMEPPLQIRILDKAGQRTGYERCVSEQPCSADSDAGKAWYLVVQPVDARGNTVIMPLPGSDYQPIAMSAFGIAVDHKQYRKAMQQKTADGHVKDPIIGNKAAYWLSATFDKRAVPYTTYDNPTVDPQNITASF
ncbi:TPA: DUF6384 family protein [Pseudomonas putida]